MASPEFGIGLYPPSVNIVPKEESVAPKQVSFGGLPALVRSSDRASEDFTETLRALNPDGYIIGIGAGGIFSFIEAFDPEVPPKGLLGFDIDPYVVGGGKILVAELQKAGNWEEFRKNYFEQTETEYFRKFLDLKRENKALIQGRRKWQDFTTPMGVYETKKRAKYKSKSLNILEILERNFGRLQQLARNGKMNFIYADFANKRVINGIRNLPEFNNLINIIYVTNLLQYDGIVRETVKEFDKADVPQIFIASQNFRQLEPLTLYVYQSGEDLSNSYFGQIAYER